MFKRFLLCALILTVGVSMAITGCETAHLKGAKIHIKYGRWEEAKKQLALAMEKEPQNGEIYYFLGVIAANEEEFEEMNKYYIKAVYLNELLKPRVMEDRKRHYGKFYNRGRELIRHASRLNKPEQKREKDRNLNSALVPLKNAITIDPSESGAFELIGQIYDNLGQSEKALEVFEDLYRKDPTNIAALLSLGTRNLQNGFSEKEDLEKRKQDISKGIEYLEKFLLFKPDDISTMRNLALGYTAIDRNEDAKALFEKAIEKNPNDPDLHAYLGNTLNTMGLKEEAVKEFKLVEELAPENVTSLLNLSQFYLDAEDWEQALKYLNKAAEVDPNNSAVWYNKGVVFGRMNRTKEAEEAFKKAEELENK